MKKLFLSIALMVAATATSQTLSTGAAINNSGKQRTVPQRMAKAYLAIGAGVNVEEATRELDEAAAAFNETLRGLETFSKNKETTDAINFTAMQWAKFRVNVLSTPTVENAEKIMIDANNLTNACNLVTERIVASSGQKSAFLTSTSGKQRTYIQKIAMYYMALYWEVPYKNLTKEMNDAIADYETGLATLVNSPENTEEINKILKFQQSEWQFLKKAFEMKDGKMSPASVFSSTNLIVKEFTKATALYEKLIVASR